MPTSREHRRCSEATARTSAGPGSSTTALSTCAAMSVCRRSAMRARPLAADHLTSVDCNREQHRT